MKLDKIKFAILVAFIVEEARNNFDDEAIAKLDNMIDIEVPQPSMMNPETLHVLMALMHEGNSKIEAIKQHRMMTGYGLKESKDIVEKYWQDKDKKAVAVIDEMLAKYPETKTSNYTLSQFDDEELRTIRKFILSFR